MNLDLDIAQIKLTEEEKILVLAKKIEHRRHLKNEYKTCHSKLVELERHLSNGNSNGPKQLQGGIGITIGTLEKMQDGKRPYYSSFVCRLPIESGNYLISLLIAHAKKEIES